MLESKIMESQTIVFHEQQVRYHIAIESYSWTQSGKLESFKRVAKILRHGWEIAEKNARHLLEIAKHGW